MMFLPNGKNVLYVRAPLKSSHIRVYVMGHYASKNSTINKNHNKQKMFRIGISAGRNDLNLEGHVQLGYCSKTVKNYNRIEKTQEKPICQRNICISLAGDVIPWVSGGNSLFPVGWGKAS